MNESMANQAYMTQGRKGQGYEGHDRFQNGVLDRSQNITIYTAGWTENWGASEGNSGFFTDRATVESCVHDGVLNTNELDGKIQTNLSTYNGVAEAHSNVSAYDVDFKRLDELKKDNPKLYDKLTAPDGEQSGEIKVAYGEVSANPQNGPGGGHQYYIDPDTFRDAIKNGVFKYNPNESYGINSDITPGLKPIERESIDLKRFDKDYRERSKIAHSLRNQQVSESQREREKLGISVSEQNNRHEVKAGPNEYIAKPDTSFDYSNITTQETTAIQETNPVSASDETRVISSRNIIRQTTPAKNVNSLRPKAKSRTP